METDIVFSFDTTGSMYPCLTQVRRHIRETATRLFLEIPGIRVGIIAHGDYCDAGDTYVLKSLAPTDDLLKVAEFVDRIGPTGGGDSPECYELVLHEARALPWGAGRQKVLVVIGDDVPHGPEYPGNRKRIDWRNELGLLIDAGIHVYGVHALAEYRRHARFFYEEIAKRTGGFYVTLDQFAAITDLVLAICFQQAGGEALGNYEREVQRAGRMDRSTSRMFGQLSGRAPTATPHMREESGSLRPVPPGRFQALRVDGDCDIKGYVVGQGLGFNKGRGFYEFTKTETIQSGKEVVLMRKGTGDLYSGNEARRLIGLRPGEQARLSPAHLAEYTVFVQSTSSNRKLIGGTWFLYEVSDWDRKAA